MINFEKIRADFPMLQGKQMHGHPLVYLDSAATTFKPKVVLDAIGRYYTDMTANAHRGDYDLSHDVDEAYEGVRAKVARFLNAPDVREIVFTSGASGSLNLVAYGLGEFWLKPGDEVLLTEAEHASNVLPWFKVTKDKKASIGFIPLDGEGRLTPENVKLALTPQTKVVSIAHVTNVMGYIADIKAIAEIVHAHGALLVVDGAQSVPHMKTDVQALDIDFLAFSGHKMLGPTGVGVLYGRYDLLLKMPPFLMGGGMSTRFDTCGEVVLALPPHKFEAGTPPIEGVIGLGAAVDYLSELGLDEIHAYEGELRRYAIEKLKKLDNVILYNEHAEAGIITFNIKDVFAQDAASLFNTYGIAVRAGQHCAKILMDYLGTVATVRASINFYNTKADIDRFVDVCAKGGEFLDAFFL